MGASGPGGRSAAALRPWVSAVPACCSQQLSGQATRRKVGGMLGCKDSKVLCGTADSLWSPWSRLRSPLLHPRPIVPHQPAPGEAYVLLGLHQGNCVQHLFLLLFLSFFFFLFYFFLIM